MGDKHYAWDYGVLWFLGKPKTTKTLCNRRVQIGKIDNESPTCPECIKAHREEIEAANAAVIAGRLASRPANTERARDAMARAQARAQASRHREESD